MLIQILKPDFEFKDERGELVQLVHDGYKQFNVVTSCGGVLRGDHYHKLNNEVFFVISGSFELKASLGEEEETYVFKKGDMFLVPPWVVHSFNYIEDSVVVALYDKGVEMPEGSKDIFSR